MVIFDDFNAIFSADTAPWVIALFVVIIIWSAIWKLFALWKAARKGSAVWFVILALVNSIGVLEILYIFVFSKMEWKCCKTKKPKVKTRKKKRR